MIFTVNDVIPLVKRYVNGGSCTTSELLAAINECTMHFLDAGDWKSTVVRVRFFPSQGYICLPEDIDKILTVIIDRGPKEVFNRAYEFLPGGPGLLDSCIDVWTKDLVDMGYFPTMRTLPHGTDLQLFAMCTETADVGLALRVRGRGTGNVPVLVDGQYGETVPVQRNVDGIDGVLPSCKLLSTTAKGFRSIDFLSKPVSSGYITLYAYDPDGPIVYWLGKYAPHETTPSYRWYRVTGHDIENGDCIVALAKLRYVPRTSVNDVLQIQSLIAYKAMVRALNAYNSGDVTAGMAFEGQAVRYLRQQLRNTDHSAPALQIQMDEYAFGATEGIL